MPQPEFFLLSAKLAKFLLRGPVWPTGTTNATDILVLTHKFGTAATTLTRCGATGQVQASGMLLPHFSGRWNRYAVRP